MLLEYYSGFHLLGVQQAQVRVVPNELLAAILRNVVRPFEVADHVTALLRSAADRAVFLRDVAALCYTIGRRHLLEERHDRECPTDSLVHASSRRIVEKELDGVVVSIRSKLAAQVQYECSVALRNLRNESVMC